MFRTVARLFLVCLFSYYSVCRAQLCTGSLGDPIVDITFGSGANFGPSLRIANYQYVANNCPNDGSYTVANSMPACFSGTFHTVSEDHTPNDVNGYMMIVNASFTPGDFYSETINNLCENTTYEFAAWLMNAQQVTGCDGNSIKPNITFHIEALNGDVLLNYNTGDIAASTTPEWKQYGAFFTVPPGASSVKIRMTNNAPGGCGNDILLDDITFRPCGAKIRTRLNGHEVFSDVLCEGDSKAYTLKAELTTAYVSPQVQWQQSNNGINWTDIPGATDLETNVAFNQANAGNYYYRLVLAESANFDSPNCRVSSDPILIRVVDIPPAQISYNSQVCEGSSLNLQASPGSSFSWQGPAGFTSSSPSPVLTNVTAANSGTYTLSVTSAAGCVSSVSTYITVNPRVQVDAGQDVAICSGESTVLHAQGGTTYLWTPAAGLDDPASANPVASPSVTTTYTVTTVNAAGCTYSDQVVVNVLGEMLVNAGPDQKVLTGKGVRLSGYIDQATSFSWSPTDYLDDPTSLNPIASPPYNITYTLTASSGCEVLSDEVNVRVLSDIIIPTAFSPNNDGVNDKWIITSLDAFPNSILTVYNRDGNIVYKNTGYTTQWDGRYRGRELPVGTYYYLLDFKEEGMQTRSGWVTLVR